MWKRPGAHGGNAQSTTAPANTSETGIAPSLYKKISDFLEKSKASKVVDANGDPLVVYHGTDKARSVFDRKMLGSNTRGAGTEWGFFFAEDFDHAKYWAKHAGSHEVVEEVFLRVLNPAEIDAGNDGGLTLESAMDDALMDSDHDGARIDNMREAGKDNLTSWIVFDSEQIKSAIGNTGAFSPDHADIRYAIAPGTPPQVAPPPMTRIEMMRRAIQDRFLRFKTVQNWLKQRGINLTPDADVYGAEERSVKRFAARAEDFRNDTLRPLVQEAAKAKYAVTGGDLIGALLDGQPLPATFQPSIPEYLIAQHAAERNAVIAKINPKYPDGGSGLMNQQATDLLARYRALPDFAAFSNLAERFRAIADGTKTLLLNAGILSADQVAAWNRAYQHYVPLKGGPEDGAQQGAGSGLSVNGRQRRALGIGEAVGESGTSTEVAGHPPTTTSPDDILLQTSLPQFTWSQNAQGPPVTPGDR